jgi:DNA-binding NarL/FixJ family response regulator
MKQQVRVLIADDQVTLRRALQAVLAAWPEIKVVGVGASGVSVAQLIEICRPTLVLMDLPTPGPTVSRDEGLDGLEVIRLVKTRWPQVRLVVLTMHTAQKMAALAAGADTYLLKGCTAETLRNALHQPGQTAAMTELRWPATVRSRPARPGDAFQLNDE